MSESLISNGAGIFPCPSCGEMIYSDAEKCRFCSAPIDSGAAAFGAELQARVNSACNQAKLMRNGAGIMWLFFALSSVPFLPFGWGFLGLFIAIPIWLIRWQVKFRGLETSDPDFKRAKRDRFMTLLIWIAAVVAEIVVIVHSLPE